MKPSRRFSFFLLVNLLVLIFGSIYFLNSNIQKTSGFNLAQAILIIGMATFALSFALYTGALVTDQYYRKNDPKVKEAHENEILKKDIDERSKYFLGISIPTLYYVNSEEINNIYATYFGEDVVTAITSESLEEVGGEINAVVAKAVGVKQADKDTTKTIKKYKPREETALSKFLRYQEAVILKKQINLWLNFESVDFQQYNDFEANYSWFIDTYKIDLSKSADEIQNKRDELWMKGIEKTTVQLEEAKDLVLMEEKFNISEDEKNYICTYIHPITNWISYRGLQVTIKFLIPKDGVSNNGIDFSQVIGKVIPLRVFGKVIVPLDRNSNNSEMLIKPIGVY